MHEKKKQPKADGKTEFLQKLQYVVENHINSCVSIDATICRNDNDVRDR